MAINRLLKQFIYFISCVKGGSDFTKPMLIKVSSTNYIFVALLMNDFKR